MTWSYRKRIKVIPGVHLNISKRGISTNIGVRGANITISGSGAHLNIGIPGTGIRSRIKLSEGQPSLDKQGDPDLLKPLDKGNIFSAEIHEITCQNMQGIKEAIALSLTQRGELLADLNKVRASLLKSRIEQAASYLLIYGLLSRSAANRIKGDIEAKLDAIQQLKYHIDHSQVGLDVQFDQDIRMKYERAVEAFKRLCSSQKIWDVTNAEVEDRKKTRSAASILIKKTEVKFGLRQLPGIQSQTQAMWLQNANGGDIYIYPTFIVMFSNKSKFGVIGLDELGFEQGQVRFVENGIMPKDAMVVGQTWAKVNANGTPDRRFKENHQIPIALYGQFQLLSSTGLREEYQFSNCKSADEFGSAFSAFQSAVKALKNI